MSRAISLPSKADRIGFVPRVLAMAEDPRKIPRDPREPLLRRPDGCTEGAHLNSPAGGPGPGRFRDTLRRELIKGGARVIVGPLGSILTDYLIDHEENAKNVLEACDRALKNHVGQAIEEETGRALKEILEGILQGLILMLAIVAASTGLGAGAGAAIGALAAGVGAAPGAAVGARLGFQAGIWILEWMGLAFLAVYVGTNLGQVTSLLVPAVERAWNAGKHCATKQADIDAAARQIARAVAILFRLILEAIVMYLLAQGAAAVASRLPRLLKGLRESKLGKGFAEWIERNHKGMIEDPRLNPNLREPTTNRGGGAASSPATRPSAPLPKEASPPKYPAKKASEKYRAADRKRSVEEVQKLRKDFDGGIKQKFIKDYADSPEAIRRFTPAQRAKMKATGQMPKGWVVHHKKPLFRGGTNDPSNFRVMKSSFHTKMNKRLHYYPEGQNPYGAN